MSPTPSIFCVDDDASDREALASLLRSRFAASHVIETAASGEDALPRIGAIAGAGGEVHLVLCERDLPGMKGEELLARVHEAWPEVMAVLLARREDFSALARAVNEAGLHHYVRKPCDPELLASTITALLERHRGQRELAREHERLERRTRQLHHLHQVGLRLADASQSEGVLGLMAEAARALARAEHAQAVAQILSRERPWWSSPAASPFTINRRKAIEAELGRLRAGGAGTLPLVELPADMRVVPVANAGVLFGWIFLAGGPEPSAETYGLLSILAGQAATTLHNIQLVDERLGSERLSTIGRMISTIVHDFRNPMMAVRGYAEMIAVGALPSDGTSKAARLIVEETDRLNGMIDEILEFTRGGASVLKRQEVGVEELTAKLKRLIDPDLEARGIRFALDLGYRGTVSVDVDRLLRAMLNIASNALDAMDPGGTLAVRSRGTNGHIEIEVADTGHGIPEELQARIYEPFFTHGKPRGIGLGMSITRKIVEEHGGRIRLASRVGTGTSFTLCLPVLATGEAQSDKALPLET
jgi:signal transduction histidine kinase/CheY-like chemotaxis protein